MNKNTTFQTKTHLSDEHRQEMQQSRSSEKYYSMKMTQTQLLDNEHYIAGSSVNFIQAFDELLNS